MLAIHAFDFFWEFVDGQYELLTIGSPYFLSQDSGNTWDLYSRLFDIDATLAWGQSGTAYAATLDANGHMNILSAANVTSNPNLYFHPVTSYQQGGPDQPWIKVFSSAGVDAIYVGFNNLFVSGAFGNASVDFSLDGGITWNAQPPGPSKPPILLDTTSMNSNSPAIRLAISGDGRNVFALFQRYTSRTSTGDYNGDVVLVRDDNRGLDAFADIPNNGTMVAKNIVIPGSFHLDLPTGTFLGSQRIASCCDVAVHPLHKDIVYVAYTEVINKSPVLRVWQSLDRGQTFHIVYTAPKPASLPALAVARDGTVGLLYLDLDVNNFEVKFIKGYGGLTSATVPEERTLARFPNNNPMWSYDPYLGDYFGLYCDGWNFYGTFAASNDPSDPPSNFPSGVFFQRSVNYGGIVQNNFWLTQSGGKLWDDNGEEVSPSIDPFFFYDLAPMQFHAPQIYFIPPFYIDPSDPFAAYSHFVWPALPSSYPQFQLQQSTSLNPATWTAVTNQSVIQTNGVNEFVVAQSQSQQYFRLNQSLASGTFNMFASSSARGAIQPTGVFQVNGGGTQTFTATPSNNYAVDKWFVDGSIVQSNSPSLTLTNINSDHSVAATFIASNDISVTIQGDLKPALLFTNLTYIITVQNDGLQTVTGVKISQILPGTVSFVSANASQGTVTNSGTLTTASLGTLQPGASATVNVVVVPYAVGPITSSVIASCDQNEPDMSNNTASDLNPVLQPVTITTQPLSQTVTNGSTVSLSVGVGGTPTFNFQWFFNGTPLQWATNATLTITNIAVSQAGSYSASAFQQLGPEDVFEADSQPAILTVQ